MKEINGSTEVVPVPVPTMEERNVKQVRWFRFKRKGGKKGGSRRSMFLLARDPSLAEKLLPKM